MADDLAERIDAHLQKQVAGIVGARPSRQAWIVAALETALAGSRAAPEPAPAPAKADTSNNAVAILLLRYLRALKWDNEEEVTRLLSLLVPALEAKQEIIPGHLVDGTDNTEGRTPASVYEVAEMVISSLPMPPKPARTRKRK